MQTQMKVQARIRFRQNNKQSGCPWRRHWPSYSHGQSDQNKKVAEGHRWTPESNLKAWCEYTCHLSKLPGLSRCYVSTHDIRHKHNTCNRQTCLLPSLLNRMRPGKAHNTSHHSVFFCLHSLGSFLFFLINIFVISVGLPI